MIIDELFAALPAPLNAAAARHHDWGAVTGRLGEPLPGDYMQFIDAFGLVELNDYLIVFDPFSPLPHVDFFQGAFAGLASLRGLKNEFPDEVPLPLYYENGGLLPWGMSVDGDLYCWVTKGLSGVWSVAVVPRAGGFERFDMTMTQFIARAFSGAVSSRSIPQELVGQGPINCRPIDQQR